ncbi:MAG: alanine--tRNA ligase [Peptostreptococcaceae bacterium]|nr:alanine--tRNA ligase [Peptostreptococcaceae bacterium]
MDKLGLNEIRKLFIDFFEEKGHYVAKSASLIPRNDNSLLIINSGMAPLKPYFSGVETPPAKRMTTCQKCIRTGDIENVGVTSRHATFFEMLGNFSFGDYFKEESLNWGWEFMTDYLHMPTEKIWATVYEEDDEAYEIWKKIGLPEERIVRLGKKDNFWEIGLGPCGPCSELFFDRGEKYGCGKEDCAPGCSCDRYIEFWNHVFTQFSREEDGSYTDLANPNIDTGMGLERLACIMQNVDSIFDVDTIKYILNGVTTLANVEYKDGEAETDMSIRIITDHIRSMVFMISDGILPGNEGRGYVLRRIIRRAARHGKMLGIEAGFLTNLSELVIEVSGEAYPELIEKNDFIKKIISVEENKFSQTLDQGMLKLKTYIDEMNEENTHRLDGDLAFKLYDTYGFPLELTEEILAEHNKAIDLTGFKENMQQQREMARSGRKCTEEEAWKDVSDYSNLPATKFIGYDNLISESKVIYTDSSSCDKMLIALDKTPFYATSGGQINDMGKLYNENFTCDVVDVVKENKVFLHITENVVGNLSVGDVINAEVNPIVRNNTSRNHSATHLLQKALQEIVGEHVHQAGSLVANNYLRFDFNHFEAVSKDDLKKVENRVNEMINTFLPVTIEEMPIAKAKKLGAMALFGEKYGKTVRVIKMGDFSIELCGGTHVKNTGFIGSFKILSESGVASGVRRIEAVTGKEVLTTLNKYEDMLNELSTHMKTTTFGISERLLSILDENKELKKAVKEFKNITMNDATAGLLEDVREIKGIKLLTKSFKDTDINQLRTLTDDINAENKGIIMVFASETNGKVMFIVSVSDDLVEKGYHAGKMIKTIASVAGGGGGGKANMAQAGAKDPSKIADALGIAETLI